MIDPLFGISDFQYITAVVFQPQKLQLALVFRKTFIKTGNGDLALDVSDLPVSHLVKMLYGLAGTLYIVNRNTVHIPGLERIVQQYKGELCVGKYIQVIFIHLNGIDNQTITVALVKLPFFFRRGSGFTYIYKI